MARAHISVLVIIDRLFLIPPLFHSQATAAARRSRTDAR